MLTSRRYQDENSDYGATGRHRNDLEKQQSTLKTGGKAGLLSARKGLQSQGTSGVAAARRALGDITNATPVLYVAPT